MHGIVPLRYFYLMKCILLSFSGPDSKNVLHPRQDQYASCFMPNPVLKSRELGK